MTDPRVVAHRGFTRDAVENTIPALEAALSLGCRAIEFDVHATADGVWVVHHDPTLTRIHGVDLTIADSTFEVLRAAAPVATLAEALEVFPIGCRPIVEVKPTDGRHFDALADDLARLGGQDPIVVVHGDLPRRAHEAFPGAAIYLFEEDWDAAYARRHEPIAGYDLKHDTVPPERIAEECARFRAAGKEIAVFTVNEAAEAQVWLEAGVEWVITDRPDEVGLIL